MESFLYNLFSRAQILFIKALVSPPTPGSLAALVSPPSRLPLSERSSSQHAMQLRNGLATEPNPVSLDPAMHTKVYSLDCGT